MSPQQWKMFKAMVAAATGIKHTYRYRAIAITATQGTTTPVQLLTTDDDPDYDVAWNSTTPHETEVGSRILGIDLNMFTTPSAAGEIIEWCLYKDPDGMLGTVSPTVLFQADRDATAVLLRKYAMAYGMFKASASKDSQKAHVRISGAAMRRAGTMLDGDALRLVFLHSGAAANGEISMYGRIWTRK